MLIEQLDRVDGLPRRIIDPALAAPSTTSDQGIERHPEPANSDPLAQELLHRAVLESISVGVCVFDGQERMILCNRRYAEIYGLSHGTGSPRRYDA